MAKKIVIVVAAIALLGAAFFGGTVFAGSSTPTQAAGGRAGGPMGQRSAADQANIQNMSESERQAYLQQQSGSQGASGTVGARGSRGGLVEGEVVDVAADSLTIKVGTSSQTIYIDDTTVIGYAEGAAKMAAGSSILVFSQPSADNVVTAQAILVK